MRKYRLSYLQNGIFYSLDLSKLDCLKEFNTTDIKVIDKFTSNFINNREIVDFLIKNNILSSLYKNTKLQITIDSKDKKNNIVYNKPIFNSNKLILKKDKEKLNASYGAKTIKANMKNGKYMKILISNYKEKYQKAITSSGYSSIYGYLNYIELISTRIEKK